MRATPLSPQVEQLLALVSPRVGVVRNLARVARGAGEPSPPIIYHALLAHFDFKNADSQERAAAGKGLTDSDAIGGAIGEAIERYCAYHPALGAILRVRRGELDRPSISPTECVLYSASQYERRSVPYPAYAEDAAIGWLPAWELPERREIFMPAFLAYLNYTGPAGEDHFTPPTSNGLAAGPDLESAILAGLAELIERDGFLLHWMNRLPAPEVEFDGGIAGDIRRHYRRFGTETRVFNVSTDLPMYVMMAVALGDGHRSPAALVGLGCHLDPRTALNKALFEICQIRPGETRRFVADRATDTPRDYAAVRTLQDHSAFFHSPERRGELAFLLDAGRSEAIASLPNRSTSDPARDLAAVVDALARAGCRIAYADVTTSDIRPYGIRVVRTLATGLQPIHFGHGEERLGGRRLFDLPSALGYSGAARTEQDLNPCPHPLA